VVTARKKKIKKEGKIGERKICKRNEEKELKEKGDINSKREEEIEEKKKILPRRGVPQEKLRKKKTKRTSRKKCYWAPLKKRREPEPEKSGEK